MKPMLEIRNLQGRGRRHENIERPRPRREQGRGARHHGAERRRQDRRCPMCSPASPATRSPTARCCSTAKTCWRCRRTSAPRKGLFLAFQYPLEIPGVATMTFLRAALNAQRKARGEAELSSPELIKRVRDIASKLGIDARNAAASGQCRFLGRREEAQRDAADGVAGAAALRCSTRPTPASTSTPSRWSPTASTSCARRSAPWS